MDNRQTAVYILAGKRNGTVYVGVTGDLRGRARKLRLIDSANRE